MRSNTRRVQVRESPGRPPRDWFVTVDDEGITFRRPRRREVYTITHTRALGVAVRDSGAQSPVTKEE